MRLTPSQRIHAICAFVVPIVLVLMFAPWPPDRSDTGQRSSAGRCADDQAPPHCEVSAVVAYDGGYVARKEAHEPTPVTRDESLETAARDVFTLLSGPVLIEDVPASARTAGYEALLR